MSDRLLISESTPMPTISFSGRHFQRDMILQCVRWYLVYALSYRDIEEMMAEQGFNVDHSTIHRWVVHYAPSLNKHSDAGDENLARDGGSTRPN